MDCFFVSSTKKNAHHAVAPATPKNRSGLVEIEVQRYMNGYIALMRPPHVFILMLSIALHVHSFSNKKMKIFSFIPGCLKGQEDCHHRTPMITATTYQENTTSKAEQVVPTMQTCAQPLESEHADITPPTATFVDTVNKPNNEENNKDGVESLTPTQWKIRNRKPTPPPQFFSHHHHHESSSFRGRLRKALTAFSSIEEH